MRHRLDDTIIARGLAQSRDDAFVLITGGRVFVDSQKAISGSQIVPDDARIVVRNAPRNVGRGAEKLAHALEKFGVSPDGKICLDIGAATGGFTQVLLETGAKKVYAVDTATGKLADKIRSDPRVVVMEKTDIRNISALPDTIDIIAIDVSLVSLRHILTHISRASLVTPETIVLALFKPQYETRDPAHLKGGVIRSDEIRNILVHQFTDWLSENNWIVRDQTTSPIKGSKGNVEYLFYLTYKYQKNDMAKSV